MITFFVIGWYWYQKSAVEWCSGFWILAKKKKKQQLKQHSTVFSACFYLRVLVPEMIIWIKTIPNVNYTSFPQVNQLFHFLQWFDWLRTRSRWMLSCFNLVELQFSAEQNHTFFFSFETSTVIYCCNKLCASGFGLPLLFFFPRKYSDLCSDLWDCLRLQQLRQPLFYSSQ